MAYRHGATCAAILAVALGGCGSGGAEGNQAAAPGASEQGSQTAAASTDPCSLVTAEEMSAIIGEKVVAAKADGGSCAYETEDAMASSVTIELNQTDAAGEMDTARRAAGALKDIGGAVADEGGAGADVNATLSQSGDATKIGDEAFFGPNQQLSVRKGSTYLAVSPPMMRSRMAAGNPMLSSEDKQRMALVIAEKALARLP